MNIELDHPCKNTCSGWKQGYERGVESEKERAKILEEALAHIASVDIVCPKCFCIDISLSEHYAFIARDALKSYRGE